MRRTLFIAFLLVGCSEYGVENKQDGIGGGDTDIPFTNAGTPVGNTTPTDSQFTWGTGSGGTGSGGTGTGGTATGGTGTGGTGTGTGTMGSGTGGTGSGTGGWTGTTDTATWDECDWAQAVAGWLDGLQTPYDGRVLYCHSSSGTNFVFVDSDINSCLTHVGHAYDIFPTTLCDS